jgi:hypothetical protein
MWGNSGTRLRALALGVLMIGLAACGGSSDNTPAPTNTETPAGAADLSPFLMQKDEEPGFRPGRQPGALPDKRETVTGVDAFAKFQNLPAADVRRLRSEGFISFTLGPIRGPKTAGVTNVALYETSEGARHSMAHDLRPSLIRGFGVEGLHFFSVSGVPGARGWTASKPHVGNVSWIEGRCYLTLGNQGPGPFPGPLSKAVRTIYERTKGQCP